MASIPKQSSTNMQGMFSRYRGMIILIAVFLITIAAVMVGSIWLSREIRYHNQEHEVINNMHTSYLKTSQSLLNLKLNYGEDPNSPHIKHTLEVLQKNRDSFDKHLNVMLNGGEVTLSTGETVTLNKFVDDEHDVRAAQMMELWKPLTAEIAEYQKTATSPTATSATLDLAVLGMQNVSERIERALDTSLTTLSNHINGHTVVLNWLQVFGIVGSLAFFLTFIFFSIRRLFAADMQAEAARNETTEIMDTVNTGLFLLDQDLNLGSQYSKELETLLGQTQLGGRNLIDVLGGMISDEDLTTTHSFIGQLYNPRTKERLIGDLNPLSKQAMMIPGRAKNDIRYLDFKFKRIYHDKEIVRVLVNVSDVTDAVHLEQKIEQEREQNDLQLEMLSTILQADRRMINEFVRNIKRHNTNINNTLKAPGERQSELHSKVQAIFREIHSLKGEASTLKLHGFTVMAENLETELNKLSKVSNLSGEHFLGLAVHLEELMKLTQTIDDLMVRLSSGGSSMIDGAGSQTKAQQEDNSIAKFYTQFVAELAQRNGKKVDFNYTGVEETPDNNTNTIVREIAIQLLRNAVVHGIETPEQRQAKRKLATGHVRMELVDTGSAYNLTLEDDGKGIDYEAVRAKAVRIGQYTEAEAAALSQKELLGLIFSSGFSTLDTSTEDAGRGVGLDIIKDNIMSLGGKINVATHPDAYTRFCFTFPKQNRA